ncbi:MAG: transglutaminase domain-containing protein [Bacilli bacterium]|nr:transglutaminase domain-containing protein [Bacilli bacterium]
MNTIESLELFVRNYYLEYDVKTSYGKINFIYDYKSLKKYNISKRINLPKNIVTDLDKIVYCLKWYNENLNYKGRPIEENIYDNYSWIKLIKIVKKEKLTLNCRYKTMLFTQLLISLGFKARFVRCLPYEIMSHERHCVTEVFINELNKWIIVDSTFGIIYFDKYGNPLNLYEFRWLLLSSEKIRFFVKNKEDYYNIISMWRKHIFRFQYFLYNGDKMLEYKSQRYIILNPLNYLSKCELRYSEKNIYNNIDSISDLY